MGASDFQDIAIGKTADEAFDSARQQALYDYGHAGYTGTIAEKPGFALLDLPKYTTAEGVISRLWDAVDALRKERGEETYYALDLKALTKAKASLKWLRARYTDAEIEQMHAIYDDKWGECLAFELTGKERLAALAAIPATYDPETKTYVRRRTTKKAFLFAGYASS